MVSPTSPLPRPPRIGPGALTMTAPEASTLSIPVDLDGASGFARTRATLTDTTYATSAGYVGHRSSARRPRSQFLRVAYRPDALDPIACDVERENRHGDAVHLSHQTGLAVYRALDECHARCTAGDVHVGTCDLLTAFDRFQVGLGQATAVGGRRGIRIEQPDERVDVLGLPCTLEILDDVGLLAGRRLHCLRCADAAACRGGQLTACRRRPADDLGDVSEG